MRLLQLYAPAIVLLVMAVGVVIGLPQMHGLLYFVLAVSVWLHVRAEVRK